MSLSLVLIGTVHHDPLGEVLLGALLDRLAPKILTLEMSPAARDLRRERAPRLLRRLDRLLRFLARREGRDLEELDAHPAVEDIRALLALPFEYRATAAYCRRNGAELHLLDDSDLTRAQFELTETELIRARNLHTLLALPPQPPAPESLDTARRVLAPECPREIRRAFLAGRRGPLGIGPRDERMAQAIRDLLKTRTEGTLVHVGGWVHLLEDEDGGKTLFSRLADLAPRRWLLGNGKE